jgi:hypothetical protein
MHVMSPVSCCSRSCKHHLLTLVCACSSAFREPTYGHGIIDFINSTTALWTWCGCTGSCLCYMCCIAAVHHSPE